MSLRTLAVVISVTLLLGACASSRAGPGESPADTATIERNHGYALLHSVLSDESDVDKVLIVKSPSEAVAEVLKRIGEFSRTSRESLEALAKDDANPISLEAQGLPEAESRARASIEKETSRRILFTGGKEVEFRLLLTQHEALNYIHHLSGSVDSVESHEGRKRLLAHVAKESATLRERVLTLLKSPYLGATK